MTLKQCQAVVLHGRDQKGNRAGLVPPRRCQRPATCGTYCGVHVKQAEMQDLLQECLSPSWELRVRAWRERKRRLAETEGVRVAMALAKCAQEMAMPRLASFLRYRARECGRVWAEGAEQNAR